MVAFDRELKNEEIPAGDLRIFAPEARYDFFNEFFLAVFGTLVLFFEYLNSRAKIRKSPARICLFFNSLSNVTTLIQIGQKLWDYLHFW